MAIASGKSAAPLLVAMVQHSLSHQKSKVDTSRTTHDEAISPLLPFAWSDGRLCFGVARLGALEARGTFESDSLRKRLYGVNIRELPAVIQEMNPYRRWLDPILRDDYSLAETAKDGSKQVRAALALLPEDPTYVDYVYSQLLTADTQSLPVIREALASHRTELLARLWVVAGQRGKAFEQTRIRASAALASYDSQNSQWNVIRDQVADDLVVVPMVYAADWIEAFRPMHEDLLGPLAEIYRDHKRTETDATWPQIFWPAMPKISRRCWPTC